jgi:amino-acid N-acetyltransferase
MQRSLLKMTETVANREVNAVNHDEINMKRQIEIKESSNGHRQSIVTLLQSEKLPAEDLPASLDNFYVALDQDKVVGAIGLEKYNSCGLLRSLVVNKDYRNEKIAGKLVMQVEGKAKTLRIDCIYLLTETALDYFAKKGYERISRDEVPASLKQSSEFSHVCPQSAIVMQKYIG